MCDFIEETAAQLLSAGALGIKIMKIELFLVQRW